MLEDFENIGLIEFLKRFKNDQKCMEYLTEIRWPNGIACPFCSTRNPYETSRGYKCRSTLCFKKFTITKGTVFENTKFPLQSWLFVIYNMAINKKSISSIQLGKNMDLSQKTAWVIATKIRYCLKEKHIIKLSGIVEIDEVYIGKSSFNKWSRINGFSNRKEPILGLIQRGGRVVIAPIKNRSSDTLRTLIKTHVAQGSTIYTDGWASYRGLKDIYDHDYVDHSVGEYSRGQVHTNTIEGIWASFKKSIRNTHHFVSDKHIEAYCDEVAFRHNYNGLTFTERFNEILYRCLTNKPKITQYAGKNIKRKGDIIRGEFKAIRGKIPKTDVA